MKQNKKTPNKKAVVLSREKKKKFSSFENKSQL
jgi:hypothetical protein